MKVIILSLVYLSVLMGNVDRFYPYPISIDAEEVAKQTYFVNHQFYLDNQFIKSTKKNSMLIVKYHKGSKPMVLRAKRYLNNNYDDGITKSKDLIVFLSGNLRGTGILAREYTDEKKSLEILMWLPALRKVRRMAEPSKNIGYSEADIAFLEETKLRRLSDDKYVLLGKKTMQFNFAYLKLDKSLLNRFTKKLPQKQLSIKSEVYLLKAIPKENAWYDYRIDYVDTKHFTTYRSHFYVEDKVVKTVDRHWRKLEDIEDERAYMWDYWYSINPETQFETVNYIPAKIVTNNVKNVKSSFWSQKTLKKIKR